MSIAYVNGRYLPHGKACVHIEDRGYQFADGIYEYIAFYNRRLLDMELHMERLLRSLKALEIALPNAAQAVPVIVRELVERGGRDDGGIYIQISRGVAKRDHPFPVSTKPSVVATVCAAKTPKPHEVEQGVSVITAPDERWARCDIKSVALLANVLAKQAATKAKAREAWLLVDGTITEGAVSNAYIVLKNGELVSHPADRNILGGVTRNVVLQLAKQNNIKVSERPFTAEEARNASEAFLTSTSANVLPVTRLDGQKVGDGKPGEVTLKLLRLYQQHITKQTGKVWQ